MLDSFSRPLKILLLTDALVLIAGAMILPFYALLVQRSGGDVLEAGLGASVFAVAAGISSLLAGRYGDRVKDKVKIVAGGYFIIGLSFFLYLAVDSIITLLVVQALIGLAQASYAAAYDALYGQHIDDQRQASSRWGAWEASNYFSIAIGAVMGSLVVKYLGFEALFVVMGCLCLISSGYLFLLPKRTL